MNPKDMLNKPIPTKASLDQTIDAKIVRIMPMNKPTVLVFMVF